MPKFSIITSFYKVEPYARDCIDSILAQTYRDFELILVDDGSPDNCGAIIDEYAARDPRVTAIHKENGGLSSARNAGLDAARGDYIYFVDGDDRIRPTLLETVGPYADEGYDLVAFNYSGIFDSGRRKIHGNYIKKQMTRTFDSEPDRYSFITEVYWKGKIHWEVWNRIFRRDIIERWKIRFADNREVFAEDLYFGFCYVAHITRIMLIPDVLYDYRVRSDSIMGVREKELLISEINNLINSVGNHYSGSSDCTYLTRHFPSIYCLVQMMPLRRLLTYKMSKHISTGECRRMLKNGIPDYQHYVNRMKDGLRDRDLVDLYFREWRWYKRITQIAFDEEVLEFNVSRVKHIYNRALIWVVTGLYNFKVNIKKFLNQRG